MVLKKSAQSVFMILFLSACVDRLAFDLSGTPTIIPVIVGFISDQPGPYQVTVSKSFDIQNDAEVRTPLSIKSLILSDNTGLSEELTEVKQGIFQTSPTGIRGIVGRVYTLKIELPDGRVYESFPDTLLNSGTLDSVYFNFISTTIDHTTSYGFDIFFNATATQKSNFRFLWQFTGTFQAETNPELDESGCVYINGHCNFRPVCSGLRNIAVPDYPPNFIRVAPCECCTCWYNLYNRTVFLNDDALLEFGRFNGTKIYSLTLDAWVLTHKLYYEVNQFSLTRQTYRFWNAIRNQEEAVNSIFQPINGKIPGNFNQLSGTESPVAGIFYAAAVSKKTSFIYRDDVPNENLIPTNKATIEGTCLELFPNASNVKPPYWD